MNINRTRSSEINCWCLLYLNSPVSRKASEGGDANANSAKSKV